MIQIAVSDAISNLHIALIKTFLETFEVQEKGKGDQSANIWIW